MSDGLSNRIAVLLECAYIIFMGRGNTGFVLVCFS